MDHFYDSIEGWAHYLIPVYKTLVPTLPPHAQVVEVGCWYGRSTACLAVELINSNSLFKLYAVDHWLGCKENYYQLGAIQDAIKVNLPVEQFKKNMAPVIDLVDIVRMRSVAAASRFTDNSLDMVILDDDHSYESVINSIAAWAPKVKPGGYLIGDDCDANYPGVSRAVRKYFGTDWTLYHHGQPGDTQELPGAWVWRKPEGWAAPEIKLPADPWAPEIPDVAPAIAEAFTTEQLELIQQMIDTAIKQNVDAAVQAAIEQKFSRSSLQNSKVHNIM